MDPHWFNRLDRRAWPSWQRAIAVYNGRDSFEEGYQKFTASVSFFLSVWVWNRVLTFRFTVLHLFLYDVLDSRLVAMMAFMMVVWALVPRGPRRADQSI